MWMRSATATATSMMMLSWLIQPVGGNGRERRRLIHVHVLMRDEKEGRKKQARSNKQQGNATQHTQGSHFSEGKKKEASKVKKTRRQSNTAHPRQSLFLRDSTCML